MLLRNLNHKVEVRVGAPSEVLADGLVSVLHMGLVFVLGDEQIGDQVSHSLVYGQVSYGLHRMASSHPLHQPQQPSGTREGD